MTIEKELSDTSKEKVCLITDINKLSTYLYNAPITDVEMFDELYDASIEELETLNNQLVMVASYRNMTASLRLAIDNIKKEIAQRRNDEEGD